MIKQVASKFKTFQLSQNWNIEDTLERKIRRNTGEDDDNTSTLRPLFLLCFVLFLRSNVSNTPNKAFYYGTELANNLLNNTEVTPAILCSYASLDMKFSCR